MSDDGSGSLDNIWYVSDGGSDHNDCHSASAPCRNLQIILDRATDGADIYVTSDTLALNFDNDTHYYHTGNVVVWVYCIINSSLSYTLRSLSDSSIKVTCSGMYVYLLVLFYFFQIQQIHCITVPMSSREAFLVFCDHLFTLLFIT